MFNVRVGVVFTNNKKVIKTKKVAKQKGKVAKATEKKTLVDTRNPTFIKYD